MAHRFDFGGSVFEVAGEAALYWPARRALLVADLHLEKASFFALGGQMLPPYDSIATLDALSQLVTRYQPDQVLCLGDNFHDDAGEARLRGDAAKRLSSLTAQLDWVWIVGNHDPAVSARWGGRVMEELLLEGIMLRHAAIADWHGAEISGHFHPKYRQEIRGRMVSRRCFLIDERKLILPAFGALTGGLDVRDPAYAAIFTSGPFAALVPTAQRLLRFPLEQILV